MPQPGRAFFEARLAMHPHRQPHTSGWRGSSAGLPI